MVSSISRRSAVYLGRHQPAQIGALRRGQGAGRAGYLTLPQTLLGPGSWSVSPQVPTRGGKAEWPAGVEGSLPPGRGQVWLRRPESPRSFPSPPLGQQPGIWLGDRAGSQSKGDPQPWDGPPAGRGSAPPAPTLGSFSLEWGEEAKALRGNWPNPTVSPRSSSTARPLSVLSPSMCWEPKGPGKKTGTGQSDRSHLLLSNWLLAQGRLPSLTWGQALSESCLAPLSPLPLGFGSRFAIRDSQQVRRGKEGRRERALRWVAPALLTASPRQAQAEGRWRGWVSPLALSLLGPPCPQFLSQSSAQRNLKFDPLGWLSFQLPDSSLSTRCVSPASFP